MNLDAIRAAAAPYTLLIKAGLVLVVGVALFVGGCNRGAAKWKGKHDAAVAEHKAVLDNLARLTREAAGKAKVASQKVKADRIAADQRFRESEREADLAQRDLAAALRRGSVSLRPEWSCPPARPAAGGTAGAARGQDGEAAVRRAREGAILDAIADADHADRWIVWLQSELTGTREACK